MSDNWPRMDHSHHHDHHQHHHMDHSDHSNHGNDEGYTVVPDSSIHTSGHHEGHHGINHNHVSDLFYVAFHWTTNFSFFVLEFNPLPDI